MKNEFHPISKIRDQCSPFVSIYFIFINESNLYYTNYYLPYTKIQ